MGVSLPSHFLININARETFLPLTCWVENWKLEKKFRISLTATGVNRRMWWILIILIRKLNSWGNPKDLFCVSDAAAVGEDEKSQLIFHKQMWAGHMRTARCRWLEMTIGIKSHKMYLALLSFQETIKKEQRYLVNEMHLWRNKKHFSPNSIALTRSCLSQSI